MISFTDLKINIKNNKKAQAIVEFALVLPVLIAVMMGIIEFGLLLKNYLGVNHALNKAAKVASLSRGTSSADIKVIRAFLKNCYIVNSRNIVFISKTNVEYGPYILDSNETVCSVNNIPIVALPEELFFRNDRLTPTDVTDDTPADPVNINFNGYAEINVKYTHTFINALILGFQNAGTTQFRLKTTVRMVPGEG